MHDVTTLCQNSKYPYPCLSPGGLTGVCIFTLTPAPVSEYGAGSLPRTGEGVCIDEREVPALSF